ncbi:hypothetical protein C8J57DRAFT_1604305 [Mycena rebaudengoi]|nr:hypothetical protein C8J57DRAFT_1604305 [Mycena rebaudengoi]
MYCGAQVRDMRIYPDFSLISDQFPWPSTSSPQLPSILVQVSRPMSCLHPPPPHLAPGSYCLQTRLLVTTSRILHYATTPYSHSAALIPVVCLSKQYIGGQVYSKHFEYYYLIPIPAIPPGHLPFPFISTCQGYPRKCSFALAHLHELSVLRIVLFHLYLGPSTGHIHLPFVSTRQGFPSQSSLVTISRVPLLAAYGSLRRCNIRTLRSRKGQ